MLISLTQSFTLVALFTTSSSALTHPLRSRYFANQTTGLVFDGRMKKGITPATFDSWETNPYLYNSAFGQNLTWSKIISLPQVPNSLFDPMGKEAAMEVSISDDSIFVPGNSTARAEVSNRRADLSLNMSLPSSTPIGYPDVSGIKILHFSLQNNPGRSLNYSHPYNLVWMENQPFNHKQWSLVTGSPPGIKKSDPKTLAILGNNFTGNLDDSKAPGLPFFETSFVDGIWHNFGLVLDFDHNTTQVLYSTGTNALAVATPAIPNDMYGGGQYHFGVYKKSTGQNISDGANGEKTGYQESGIDESVIFGGVFMEDSAAGTVSLSPSTMVSIKQQQGGGLFGI